MKITAKFASVCPGCNGAIAIGTEVEWTKGAKARHVRCAAPTAKKAARRFVPCGYPGCNPSYCDECDGQGRYGQ